MRAKPWSLEVMHRCPRCRQPMTPVNYYVADKAITNIKHKMNYATGVRQTSYTDNYSNLTLKTGSICVSCGKKRDKRIKVLRVAQVLLCLLLPAGIALCVMDEGVETVVGWLGVILGLAGAWAIGYVYQYGLTEQPFRGMDEKNGMHLSFAFIQTIRLPGEMAAGKKAILSVGYVEELRRQNQGRV